MSLSIKEEMPLIIKSSLMSFLPSPILNSQSHFGHRRLGQFMTEFLHPTHAIPLDWKIEKR